MKSHLAVLGVFEVGPEPERVGQQPRSLLPTPTIVTLCRGIALL